MVFVSYPLLKEANIHINLICFDRNFDHPHINVLGMGEGASTHNKRGCAILTRKVIPKNPGTHLKLRPKIWEPETLGFPSKRENSPPR